KLLTSEIQEIESHKKTINYDDAPRDYIDAFLMEIKKRKENGEQEEFTEHQLSAAIYDLFTAGTETTVTTLRYAIHFLLNNPRVQEKIHEEIDRVIGPDC
uniref:Cytochrome P450 n=1 Tax=Steinernema glaseri TaxID=37863 RepID=A0A1I8AUS7_9BILA